MKLSNVVFSKLAKLGFAGVCLCARVFVRVYVCVCFFVRVCVRLYARKYIGLT